MRSKGRHPDFFKVSHLLAASVRKPNNMSLVRACVTFSDVPTGASELMDGGEILKREGDAIVDRNGVPDIIVTLPQPTPDGGLHNGNLAGPFLAADIFSRSAAAQGQTVHVLYSSDINQSHVRATTEKQGRAPKALASFWTYDVTDTLQAYDCAVDAYFERSPDSNGFVRNAILRLFEAGKLKRKEMPFYYSLNNQLFLEEAAISGTCCRCLDECKCGICEACGFTNTAATLLYPYRSNDRKERLELRHVAVLVLELEAWRDSFRAFHCFSEATRSKYRWLVDDVLKEPLPDFPISVPGTRGIPVNHPAFECQVINTWPEICLDFVFGYERLAQSTGKAPQVVNFYGYDNSCFYAFVHVALLDALGFQHYLPRATVINEFYKLNHSKLSTSLENVIRARDLAERNTLDLLRIYLVLSSPGLEQGNFNLSEMRSVLNKRLSTPFGEIARRFNAALTARKSRVDPCPEAIRAGIVMSQRVAHSFRLERFHLRTAAEDSLRALHFVLRHLNAVESTSDDQKVADVLSLMRAWSTAVAPIIPRLSQQLQKELRQADDTGAPIDAALFATPVDPSGDSRGYVGAVDVVRTQLEEIGGRSDWFETFRNVGCLVQYWEPKGPDTQTPHEQDEFYFVVRGHSDFLMGTEKHHVAAGDLILVPKRLEHRFVNQSSNLAMWIAFVA